MMLVNSKYSAYILVCLIMLAISCLSSGCFPADTHPDLDSVGGIYILLEAAEGGEEAMEQAVTIITDRMVALGIERPLIQREGARQIRVELPGYRDEQRVRDVIGQTAHLSFMGPDGKEIITGAHLRNVQAERDPGGSTPYTYLNIELDDEGPILFAEATGKFLYQPISIILDDEVISQPVVRSEITDGKAIIDGQFSFEEASELAMLLRSGALTVTLQEIEFRLVEGKEL